VVTLAIEYNGVGGDPWGGTRAFFSAETRIDARTGPHLEPGARDRGLARGQGDQVTIEVEAVLQQG